MSCLERCKEPDAIRQFNEGIAERLSSIVDSNTSSTSDLSKRVGELSAYIAKGLENCYEKNVSINLLGKNFFVLNSYLAGLTEGMRVGNFPMQRLKEFSQLFPVKSASSSSSSSTTSMSAGAVSATASPKIEMEKKVKAESLALESFKGKMPNPDQVYQVLVTHYYNTPYPIKRKSDSEMKEDVEFRKAGIDAAHKAFKEAGMSEEQWNNITPERLKAIMLASDWKFMHGDTLQKIFDLAIGWNADRKSINIFELAYLFIWLGDSKDISTPENHTIDPEQAINLYHHVFIVNKATLQPLKINFLGIVPMATKKEQSELTFTLGAGEKGVTEFGNLTRNLLMHTILDIIPIILKHEKSNLLGTWLEQVYKKHYPPQARGPGKEKERAQIDLVNKQRMIIRDLINAFHKK